MKRFLVISVAVAFCAIFAVTANASGNHQKATEEFTKTCELSPNGTVSLRNINGSLTIKTWDKNQVLIEAVKSADDEEALKELKIEVDASENSVAVRTKYPHDENGGRGHGGAVEYTLTIPEGAAVDNVDLVNGEIEIRGVKGKVFASTVNGAIHATGVIGECALETVNGSIEASFGSLAPTESAKLKSVNGSIVLHLPEGSNLDIKARTTMGRISGDFNLESSRETDEGSYVKVGDSVRGIIGKGGASVNIETVNGSIRILK